MENQIEKPKKYRTLFWVGIIFLIIAVFSILSTAGCKNDECISLVISFPIALLTGLVGLISVGFGLKSLSTTKINKWIVGAIIIVVIATIAFFAVTNRKCENADYFREHSLICW